ncbi:hypothetical protein GQ44DRAFT_600458, partial [Phaeosphaeriaceae sp. PMI808]
TSTLVLTSPNNTFVDLRFLKPTHPDQSPLPNKGESARLEWGFAGHSTSTPTADPHGEEEGVTQCTWTHWVDSRYTVGTPNIPVDEGLMYAISPDLSLEHGHAYHPHLSRISSHEEMWRDEAVQGVCGGKKVCIVMRMCDDASGARGVVVRLGQYVQGIVMVGERVGGERWEGGGGEWTRTARVGDWMVPCAVTWREEVVRVASKVRYGEFEWVVEEAWE